jgi:glycosyltransferase involved in cell wall biosynthesis
MPTIAIDARKYFDFGIGSYIQNLIVSLSTINGHHQYVVYLSPGDFKNVSLPVGWAKRESRFRKYSLGELFVYGRDVRTAGVDLFHEPHYTLPLGLRKRSVVTVHDLIHLKLHYFSGLKRLYARTVLHHAVRSAGAIIAVSQRTKDDLVEMFNIPAESVTVVHNGVGSVFRPLGGTDLVKRFRQSHALDRPYVLYVGNIKPHKNIPTLLRAFAMVRKSHPELDLAFAGGSCLADDSLLHLCRELRITDSIHDLGQLRDSELVYAYNGAEMLVLPSFYEGFGFPPLEAMACGIPAVVSSGGSVPEVVGDAAIICDPNEPQTFSDSIISLLNDSEKRGNLVSRGKRQAQQFSWKESAEKTLAVYNMVLERCQRS